MITERENRNKHIKSPRQYNFEVHILFDDAFETKLNTETNQYERVTNQYVKGLVTAVYNAAK
jgi:hypothetical protein